MVRFTTKKIDSMTLGERMKRLRSEKRFTLAEISRNTNVQVKYLEFLEEGTYSKLPAEVYVKGFLRNYANFMGINPQSLIKQYERERKIEQNINKDSSKEKEIEPIKFSSFIITPKIIIIALSILFVFSGFAYLYRQIDNFVSTPRLSIMSPTDGQTIEGRSVRVSGVAEKNSSLTINGQPIVVNEKGEFGEEIGLGEGPNTITVVAKNKFEKESNQTISVNAKYENVENSNGNEGSSDASQQGGEKFWLELKVVSNQTWVSVEADGNLVYNGDLSPDSIQKFEAKERISITSGNGKNTLIKMEGKEDEILSDKAGAVSDIVFTPNGRAQQ